jgi:uncharacterized membrane protein
MKVKTLLLAVLTLILAGSALGQPSGLYTEELEVRPGNTLNLGEYTFRYAGYGEDASFRIHYQNASTLEVLKKLDGQEVFDAEDETFEFPETGAWITMEEVGYDQQGRYIRIGIESEEDIFASSKLTTTAPDRVISSREGSVQVPLQVENTGTVNQTFSLRGETNSSLVTSFNYQGFNVTEVYVPQGETRSIDARIDIPEETSVGDHRVELVAENRSKSSQTIEVSVKGTTKERRMEMDLEQMYASVRPGEQVEVRATIRNGGEVELRNVNLTAQGPEGWNVEVEPSIVDSIRPRYGSHSFRISLEPPQDVEGGDHLVEVSAESKNAQVEPEEVRIQVQEKSGLSNLGIVLMVVSLLGLGAVYRKFGRR